MMRDRILLTLCALGALVVVGAFGAMILVNGPWTQ